MQILITGGTARSRTLCLNRSQLGALLALLLAALLALAGTIYHLVFLKAAREGWPVVSAIVRLVVHDQVAQRERFMRENLDAMAKKLGEMQARLIQLEAVGERVSGMAGVKPGELKSLQRAPGGGEGGPYVPLERPSFEQLTSAVDRLDELTDRHSDVFALIESRLLESRLLAAMVPNSKPVDGPVGSGFGFRSDPFTGRPALHTGLDFPAETGAPIRAAAGGVVITAEHHPAYGRMVEIDHGNGLVTRYAHASKLAAQRGDLVKRGQVIAHVGSSGRSTGPHLHFEVLLDGVHQNPARFLAGQAAPRRTAKRADAEAG
jgi:murein DD-endopeptidase MepM/ murein hydrolase activator NlpD